MRKLLASMTLAATAALGAVALVGSAAPAGAQTPIVCTFLVSSTDLAATGPVSVSGTAPGSTLVTVLLDGVPQGSDTSDAATGAWGPIAVNIPAGGGQISIQLPQVYAELPCIGNGGADVVRVLVETATQALPRTGSETRQYVFLGSALLAIGLVLFVGAKRRREVHSRT